MFFSVLPPQRDLDSSKDFQLENLKDLLAKGFILFIDPCYLPWHQEITKNMPSMMLLIYLWHFHPSWDSCRGREAEQHHKEREISHLQLQLPASLECDRFLSRLCLLRVNLIQGPQFSANTVAVRALKQSINALQLSTAVRSDFLFFLLHQQVLRQPHNEPWEHSSLQHLKSCKIASNFGLLCSGSYTP